MNVIHNGLTYSPWVRRHSEATPGQKNAWRTVAKAGWSNATIARIWERTEGMVAAELADLEGRSNRKPPLFVRKYWARNPVLVPVGMQGLWEQFYQQFVKMYWLPGNLGGDNGLWLTGARKELGEDRLRSWLWEMKDRYAFDGRICKWIKELCK